MTPSALQASPDRGFTAVLWAAALVSLAGFFWLLLWYLPGSIPLGHVSGIMTASADDLVRGVFYRPIFENGLYGGTRYMPLFVILQAGLMKIGLDPVVAGQALTLASLLFMWAGFLALLRGSNLPPGTALAFSLLPLAAVNVQLITLEIKCDFLAAGLNLWGLVLAQSCLNGRRRGPAAGLLFGLAFLTKLSTLYGLAAAVPALWFGQKRRDASALALCAFLTMAAGLIAIHLASQGRALAAFTACADGGWIFFYALRAPLWFLLVSVQDPFFLILFIAALLILAGRSRPDPLGLPGLYFILTLAATLILFTSPGVDGNHLLDLILASVWLLAASLKASHPRRLLRAGLILLTVLTVLSWLPQTPSIRHYIERADRPTRAQAMRVMEAADGPGDILSENPLLPVMMGRRPVVLDAYQLRLIAQARPEVEQDFNRRLEKGEFSAVILLDYSGADPADVPAALEKHSSLGAERFYGQVHFFPGFLNRLLARYQLALTAGPMVVFQPLSERPSP